MAVRFPGESDGYRAARSELLRAEKELRENIERVAALRRSLPLGGEVKENYLFKGAGGDARLAELFAPGKDTLALYSFMYGPDKERPCPMCVCMLDSLDRTAPHASQRINLAVVAKSPLERIRTF